MSTVATVNVAFQSPGIPGMASTALVVTHPRVAQVDKTELRRLLFEADFYGDWFVTGQELLVRVGEVTSLKLLNQYANQIVDCIAEASGRDNLHWQANQ